MKHERIILHDVRNRVYMDFVSSEVLLGFIQSEDGKAKG